MLSLQSSNNKENISPSAQPTQLYQPYLSEFILQCLPLSLIDIKLTSNESLILFFSSDPSSRTEQIQNNLNNISESPLISINPSLLNKDALEVKYPNKSTVNGVYSLIKNELNLMQLIDFDKDDIQEEEKQNETNKYEYSKIKEIILKQNYKEYTPKQKQFNIYSFKTNSNRDYELKYVAQYFIQIANTYDFPVTKYIIGCNGINLRQIIMNYCIRNGDFTTKIRLRGKGSGYKEGPNNEESNEPLELCISSLNAFSYTQCCFQLEILLKQIYYIYYLFECNKFRFNNVGTFPRMKQIMKYQYVVNRTGETN